MCPLEVRAKPRGAGRLGLLGEGNALMLRVEILGIRSRIDGQKLKQITGIKALPDGLLFGTTRGQTLLLTHVIPRGEDPRFGFRGYAESVLRTVDNAWYRATNHRQCPVN